MRHESNFGRGPKAEGDWLEAIQITLEAAGAVFSGSNTKQADRAPTESGTMTHETRRLLGITQHRSGRIAKSTKASLVDLKTRATWPHSHYEKSDRVTDRRATLEATSAKFTFTDLSGVLLPKAEPRFGNAEAAAPTGALALRRRSSEPCGEQALATRAIVNQIGAALKDEH